MPNYGKENFKESNVNYLNKDFSEFKTSLMDYAKSYFPNTFKDFNESSPGMMLLEMNAYVGDVLSFYIDKQYQEMILPLAEERKNILNMAKMFGYKVKPICPAFCELTFESVIPADVNDRSKVDYSFAPIYDKSIKVASSTDSKLIFETLDVIDFTISGSNDTTSVASFETDSGLVSTYRLKRKVRAVSAETKVTTFSISAPEKFKKITIADKNVVDIVSCVDSNGNNWYEVDFLAQDKVPIETHYTNEGTRDSAYTNEDGSLIVSDVPVPYSLEYVKTQKRFTRETNLDNTTSLVFGNGILKDGNTLESGYLLLEQAGIIIPGQSNDINESIDPLMGDEYSTLGEAPSQTTLTITYRVGGGFDSNVEVGRISSLDSDSVSIINSPSGTPQIDTVSNKVPASGGRDEETIDEIREKTKAFFSTQNRCVTKEDYEARVLNLSSKFGSIAKVMVTRGVPSTGDSNPYSVSTDINNYIANSQAFIDGVTSATNFEEVQTVISSGVPSNAPSSELVSSLISDLGTINIFILSYDRNKNLVGNPYAQLGLLTPEPNDHIPALLKQNIKTYLENFRIITDEINIIDGHVINFGVYFDLIAHKYANKEEVKLRCINRIKEYFHIDKMQFNQPIFISQIEYLLMDVEGVRSVNYVTITQDSDYNSAESFASPLYKYSVDIESAGVNSNGTDGYGFLYDFNYANVGGIILPPSPNNPGVFELKYPNKNIRGRVR